MKMTGARRKEQDKKRIFCVLPLLPCTSKASGFSLISAIFLLVVIAALGTFAVTLSTTQNQSQTIDVLGARAYQAALAGVEWAAFNVNQQPVNAAAPWAGCAAAQAVTVGGSLAIFSPVSVSCSATSAVEGVDTVWIYSVSSVAHTSGVAGSSTYVEQIATSTLVK
jgi:MSHA biogenesis protein MshP